MTRTFPSFFNPQLSWIVVSLAGQAVLLAAVLESYAPVALRFNDKRAVYWIGKTVLVYRPAPSGEGQKEAETRNPGRRKKRLVAILRERKSAYASKLKATRMGPPANAGSASRRLSLYDLIAGPQVRPAVWIAGPEPRISRSELAGLEGDVIVEITIDEQGRVVDTRVVMSLSPEIDQRVIEALLSARFVPAERNGVPLMSKQEVHYHFPA